MKKFGPHMTHEERISELQDMSIEITEAQTQREWEKKNRAPKRLGTIWSRQTYFFFFFYKHTFNGIPPTAKESGTG